jgi:hypothetical protein
MTLPGFSSLAESDPAKAIGETLTHIKRNHPELGDIDPARMTDAAWARVMGARWKTRQDVLEGELAALRAEIATMRGNPGGTSR